MGYKFILLILLTLYFSCETSQENSLKFRSCKSTISYDSTKWGTTSKISAAGEWNLWDPQKDFLEDLDGDGIYKMELTLPHGEYAYQLVKDGNWIIDEDNPQKKWYNGAENSNLIVPDCTIPMLEPRSINIDRINMGIEVEVEYFEGDGGAGPDKNSAAVTVNNIVLNEAVFNEKTNSFYINLSQLDAGKYILKFNISNKNGKTAEELILPVWIEKDDWTWKDALIYFAFTDRFYNGDKTNDVQVEDVPQLTNYQGGDLQGITQKIEDKYFDELGVNVIWISPVNTNPLIGYIGRDGNLSTGYHGYWPVKNREISPWFGDIDTLNKLSQVAHLHGIRIILDIVPNHVHVDHPWYNEYPEWFDKQACICGQQECNWDYRCWFNYFLPDIDYTRHEPSVAFTEEALWWIEQENLDGFRVDAVPLFESAVSRRLNGFIHNKFEKGGVEFYMVGETFTDLDGRSLILERMSENELDGQFNFPLYWAILHAFAFEDVDLSWLDLQIREDEQFYPQDSILSPLIGNHDLPRFISQANGDEVYDPWTNPPSVPDSQPAYQKLKLAFSFLLTIPGAPSIYYGDEIGMPGATDPDNRRMMRFGQQLSQFELDLLNYVKILGTARKEYKVLRRGDRTTLKASSDFYAYCRSYESDFALILINRAQKTVQENIILPASVIWNSQNEFKDIISQKNYSAFNGILNITINSRQSMILIKQN